MTQEMQGQDIEQVRALAGLFESSADELESARQQVTAAVFGFDGYGPNVDQMRGEWSDRLAPTLSDIAEALREAGDKATRNADAQEDTSNSYDGNPFAGVSTQGGSSGDDDGGGPLDWLGDKAGDLWDAGGDALDWTGDKVGDLWDAGTNVVGNVWDAGTNLVGKVWDAGTDVAGKVWDTGTNIAGNIWDAGTNVAGKLWDAGTNAVDWIGDRGSDALDWIGDRASAIGGAWANVGDSALQYWDATGGAILDGEWPRTTEVIASTIRLGGAALGAGVTVMSLGGLDPKIFDDGDPYAGEPKDVLSPRNPASVADLARTVTDAYGTDGNVRVTTVEGPNGPRVIVSVPGTETWNPSAGDNPMDLTGNLVTAGGSRSTMSDAVVLAMENANIPPGAEVMMVGHSQGGMTVADLTSDSAFVDKYNVTHAMTYGSPIDSAHIDPNVSVLEMQHQHDVVPRLDLGDSRYSPLPNVVPALPGGHNESGNHTTVTFDDPGSAFNAKANHDHKDAYPTSMANSNDPGYLAYQESLRQSGFLTDGSNASVSAQDIPVGRKN